MRDKINHKIEKTLESLDGIKSGEPNPFLLTRVLASLNENNLQNGWQKMAFYLKKPIVAVFAVLILILNIIILNAQDFSSDAENNTPASSSAAYDFAVNASGIYDPENNEP